MEFTVTYNHNIAVTIYSGVHYLQNQYTMQANHTRFHAYDRQDDNEELDSQVWTAYSTLCRSVSCPQKRTSRLRAPPPVPAPNRREATRVVTYLLLHPPYLGTEATASADDWCQHGQLVTVCRYPHESGRRY